MSEDRFHELLDEAWHMQNSPVKNALLEEAVRIADSLNNDSLGVQSRMELIESATFSGVDEKALVAFAWCLAKFDERPELFDESDLLWRYKWIATVASFSYFTRERIEKLEDDMEKRYLRAGYNLRPVHESRATNGLYLGDPERVRKYDLLSRKHPRDVMANCKACEMSHSVYGAAFLGDYKTSIKRAERVFERKMSCSCVPQNVYGHILFPLLQLGRVEEATQYHERGYRMIAGDPDYLDTASEHMLFLACTGSFRKGLSLFSRHLDWALKSFICREKYSFYLASGLLFEQLQQHARKRTRKLRLPREFELYRESGEYVIAELQDWNLNQAADFAQRFDQRNGNSWYTDNMETQRTLVEQIQSGD